MKKLLMLIGVAVVVLASAVFLPLKGSAQGMKMDEMKKETLRTAKVNELIKENMDSTICNAENLCYVAGMEASFVAMSNSVEKLEGGLARSAVNFKSGEDNLTVDYFVRINKDPWAVEKVVLIKNNNEVVDEVLWDKGVLIDFKSPDAREDQTSDMMESEDFEMMEQKTPDMMMEQKAPEMMMEQKAPEMMMQKKAPETMK